MTIQIQLTPDEERALVEQARLSGRDPVQYAQEIIKGYVSQRDSSRAPVASLIDHEFVAYCDREAEDSVTLEEVLEATASIKDSMARVIIEEERAGRF